MNIDEIPGQNPKQAELIHVHVAARLSYQLRQSLLSWGKSREGGIIDAARLGISLEPTHSAVDGVITVGDNKAMHD